MDILARYFLTLLICLPALGAVVVLALRGRAWARWIALGFAILTFLLALSFLLTYDWHRPAGNTVTTYACRDEQHPTGAVQFVQRVDLVPAMEIQYLVGIDGLSLPLVLLTTFITIRVCVALWKFEPRRESWLAMCLLLESAFLGLFLSLNFVFFLFFFAVCWLPIAWLMARSRASQGRFTLARFSAAMILSTIGLLIAMIAAHHFSGSYDLVAFPALLHDQLSTAGPRFRWDKALFILLMAAFLIRMGVFPVHRWVSHVYADAVAPVGMFVSAPLLASGAYGIFRIAYPLFEAAGASLWLAFAIIGVTSLLYGALAAMAQQSVRRLIASISTAQMGMIVLAAAMMTPAAVYGATFILIAHGITIAMLLVIAGILNDRLKQDNIRRLGGLARIMPGCGGFAFTGFLAAVGTPIFAGFVGEVLILTGVFQAADPGSRLLLDGHAGPAGIYALALLGCIGTLLLAAGVIWKVRQIFFGPSQGEITGPVELSHRDMTVLTPMLVAVVLLGILPTPLHFTFTRTTLDAIYHFDANVK